ncbi:MAG TPA: hypothetical protein VKV32_15470, partial [Stellaceae bacterium]|nr:hypothetical protein [Stellaceae bacterium]
MSNLSDHSQPGPRRHRFWAALAILILGAAAVAAIANWLTAPPASVPPPRQVAVTLPPPAPAQPNALSLPSPNAAASSPAPPPTQAPPPAANPPSAQVAVTPPPAPPSQPVVPPSAAVTNPPPAAQSGEPPAWLRYATTGPVDVRDRARIAIVIDDLGLDRR